MVLANDEFATIAEAVRRGRGVYDNLTKALLFALPTNFAQGLSIVAAIIIGMQSPLTAMQVRPCACPCRPAVWCSSICIFASPPTLSLTRALPLGPAWPRSQPPLCAVPVLLWHVVSSS